MNGGIVLSAKYDDPKGHRFIEKWKPSERINK